MALAAPQATPVSSMDPLVRRIKEGSRAWVRVPIAERIALLEELRRSYHAVAEPSVRAACEAKGVDPEGPIAGEEWLAGPLVVMRNLRLLVEALRDIPRHGAPYIPPSRLSTLENGQLSARLYPANLQDALLLPGVVGEVRFQPGVTAANLREHQATFYRRPHEGRVCAVLGGGNVNSIPPTDCLYKLFVEGTACVLKMNPVNAYLGPFLERAFAPLAARNVLAVVYGGAEEGAALVQHPDVDEVHITGSDKTHDALMWGPPGPEADARRARGEPLLRKAISSELGNISPVVIVPGPYSDGEMRFQGNSIAGMVANNASFNCNSAKLLVQPREWRHRAQVLDAVQTALGRTQVRRAWYPGADQRWKQFTEGRKGLRLVGTPGQGQLAFALLPDVDPTVAQDRVFHQEPWCTVLSETSLPGSDDPVAFLEQVVPFLNDKVWGTLCATLVVHPKSLKDPAVERAVEKAIRELRYGSVAVNTWPAAVFALGSLPWGGHPSSTPQNIQSGLGWVHNTYMLEDIEKVVLRAPLTSFPPSPWVPGHRGVHVLGRRLADFEREPSWLKVPGIALAAMRV